MKNKDFIKRVFISVLAALLAAVNLKSFVASGTLVPGGFSGTSLLIQRIGLKFMNLNFSYSVLYICFNLPGIYLAIRYLGRNFTILSIICIVLSSVLVEFIPLINITNDMLLIAVFGGIMAGVSNSLMIMAGACAGGTDFISLYFAKKKNKSCWNEVLAFNAIMLCTSGALFGWESALYSIIYQFVNTQIVKMFDNRYKKTTLFIITSKPEEIEDLIIKDFHHTCTVLEGIGGYTQHGVYVIYAICGSYEANDLAKHIMRIDEKAFINVMNSQRLIGNFKVKQYN